MPRSPTAVVARRRLLVHLDDAATRPLVIVRAPGGAGKTTLLAEWVRERPRRGVWVTLDAGAAGRPEFWRRVVDAMVASGALGAESQLDDIVVGLDIDERVLTSIENALAALDDGPLLLVLDDFHEVVDERVHDDLHRLLERGAPLHLVVGTRTMSPLESADRMARVDTAVLLTDELVFTRAEVAELVGLLDADPDAVDPLREAFGGWPLPTRTALLALTSGYASDVHGAVEQVRRNDGGLVLEGIDDEYTEFLLCASIAQRISVDFARRIVGERAEEHLARAERSGIGTWSPRAGDEALVLHPHIRGQLERGLMQRMPERVRELRAQLAADRLERADPLGAVTQFAAMGDWGSVVRVVRGHFADASWYAGMGDVLRAADPRELRRHPELLAILLVFDYANPRSTRARLLNSASLVLALLRARLQVGPAVERFGVLLGLLGAQRTSGRYRDALKTADQLVTAAMSLDDDMRAELVGILPTGWTHAATTYLYDEQLGQAEPFFRAAADVARDSDRPWSVLHAESMLSLSIALRGDMTALAPRLVEARQLRRPHTWRGSYMAAGYHLAEALDALERFDTSAARDQLAHLARHERTIEHWPLIAELRALAALVDGTLYSGVEALTADIAAHADRPATSRAMSARLAAVRADLLVADGHPRRALETADASGRATVPLRLARARAELALGRYDVAVADVQNIVWSEEPIPRAKAEALLVTAVATHALGRLSEAREAVDRALELLDTFALRRPLMTIPRASATALVELLGQDPAVVLAGVPDIVPPLPEVGELTPQELRVLSMLEQTGRADVIAARLYISNNTAKTHLRRIYRKLDVRSREEALTIARVRGVLPIDESGER